MTKWTSADEAALRLLEKRKREFFAQNRSAVERAVRQMLAGHQQLAFNDGAAQVLVDLMIDHADSLRDALAPFDSGVRPADTAG